ncbi:14543_t:CDS:1, partial [Gigaspora margarita]
MFSDNEDLLEYQDSEDSSTSSNTKRNPKSSTSINIELKRIK